MMRTLAKQPQMRAVEGKRCLSCRREVEQGCGFQLLSPGCLQIHNDRDRDDNDDKSPNENEDEK